MTAGDLITADWQIEWRGVLLGSGTSYGWSNLDGWLDLPGMRIGDQARPGRHGAYAGQQLADERVITWDATMYPATASFAAAVDVLRRVTAVEEAPDEEPLVIRLSGTAWLVNARVTRRRLPVDRRYNAQAVPVVVQWVATDPRLYSPQLQTSGAVGLPSPGAGGLVFPLVFPLTFGTGQAGGNFSLVNTGTVTTWPTFRIDGPVTGPVVTNVTTGQQLQFDPAFAVAAGQVLLVDTDTRTVTLQGVNRRSSLWVADWFGLPPGVTTSLKFTAAGGFTAGTLTAQWRHATI